MPAISLLRKSTSTRFSHTLVLFLGFLMAIFLVTIGNSALGNTVWEESLLSSTLSSATSQQLIQDPTQATSVDLAPDFWMTHGEFCAKPSEGRSQDKELLQIRTVWDNSDFVKAASEVISNAKNKWASVTLKQDQRKMVAAQPTYIMMTRDSSRDSFISKSIQQGGGFDSHVLNPLVTSLVHFQQQYSTITPVFVDCGGNIGWFTTNALAMGATVITFEPMRENMGIIAATVLLNNWRDRHHLYHNALSWEPVRVTMEPTNSRINLSNGHVIGSKCPDNKEDPENSQYGIDYMDAVSLDQVMMSRHANLLHIAAMKVDIETFEPQALNGAMRTFCHKIVHTFAVEVAYLKYPDHPCNVNKMIRTMEILGYDLLEPHSGLRNYLAGNATNVPIKKLNGIPVDQMKESDVVFRLKDTTQTPYERLSKEENADNPCARFQVSE